MPGIDLCGVLHRLLGTRKKALQRPAYFATEVDVLQNNEAMNAPEAIPKLFVT
ncbi:hypothetical protein SNOG_04355 [Parastagonospora nodorum SN15]|uniref:Uncharacterized protein n=1 Tax=Phaeosphaeria nodorum (strain SN15 / ATCC MYA-4574 / FGSC 10173) TaxID=321614 RepID=Q0UV59_PHANO|nr:hypothetical protein SNOG_04355 [Parastagonospora nodorum SN15]EAT88115.1 hypothetical protein SNOG_04355 [Parastagonospora nodorum SN15]